MNTLTEISDEYLDILNVCNEEETLSNDLLCRLERIDEAFELKAKNIVAIIKELTADCGVINTEIDRLTKRLVTKHKNIKRLQEYLKEMIIKVDKRKIETPLYTISLRKSEVVEVDNRFIDLAQKNNWNHFLRVVPEKVEPNKTAIKEHLKKGNVIDFVQIIEKQNLAIR